MFTSAIAVLMLIRAEEPLPVGSAIEFKAQTFLGKPVSAESLKGKTAVIILWGPWSDQSSRALELVENFRDRYQTKLRVVALTSWDTLQNAQAFVQANPHLKMDFWWDPAGKDTAASIAVKTFKTHKFPTVYVLSKELKVVGGFVGFKPGDDLAALIEKG